MLCTSCPPFAASGGWCIPLSKKYFFFDIDGTLTDRSTGKVVPSAMEAIHKLEENGHFVSLATGRSHYKARWFFDENGFENMVCNGGHGIVLDHQLVENKPLDYDKALALYNEALHLGYGVVCTMDDSKTVYGKNFDFLKQAGWRKEPTTYVIDPDFDPADHKEIYKLYISIPKEQEDRLTLKNSLGHLRFEKDYLMFQPDAKKEGILRMLELTGGKPEDVVVFGDDSNDLCMFDERFFSIAMGNGCQELKDKASHVTDANINDGIYKACRKFGWIE